MTNFGMRRNGGGPSKAAAAIWAAVALFILAACASEGGGMSATTIPATAIPAAIPAPAVWSIPTATATSAPTAIPTATATSAPVQTATAVPTATQTTAPAPIASAVPTATPTPAPDADFDAFAFLEKLTLEHSPRESATDDELAAALFLQAELAAMGYETELRGFEIRQIEFSAAVSPALDGSAAAERLFNAYRIALSGEGVAEGAVVDAGGGFEGDIPAGGLAGKVALIERGTITFEEKVRRVADAGAVGAIVFNNVPGPFWGRLASRAEIPAASLDREAGLLLRDAARAGEVRATVAARPIVSQSRNLAAWTADDGGGKPTVIIGAHYDTVADTQGANDNGSGVAALMEVAKRAGVREYPFAVKFVLFGAEETGLHGSVRYVEEMGAEEAASALAMLNLDVVGSGGGFEAMGDSALARMARESGEEIGERVLVIPSESAEFTSDHAPFAAVGIPALFLMADDMSRINSPQDELRFVNARLPGASAEIVLRMLDRLAARAGAESAGVRAPDSRENWHGEGIVALVDWWERE